MSTDTVTATATGFVRRRLNRRPPMDRVYPWIIVCLLAYGIADLLILNYRPLMLPTEAPPPRPRHAPSQNIVDSSASKTILDKNIFSEDGVIPPAIVSKDQPATEGDEIPQPSNLPLSLIGTLVHSNPEKSIATIEVKSKNATVALRVGKELEGMIRLTRVERTRAIFRNLNNQRLEFIEMKQFNKLAFSVARPPVSGGGGEVRQVGQNRFEINRADVLKYTADMANVLQQAAMQPRRNAQGEIECYRFVAIQPNSIFTQLGFQVGDCLKAVNGEKVDSPAKAMELYRSLKNAPSLSITAERDGRDNEMVYTVK